MRKAQSEQASDAHEAEQEQGQEAGSERARESEGGACLAFALPACLLHAPAARKGGRASGCLACRRRRTNHPTNAAVSHTVAFRSFVPSFVHLTSRVQVCWLMW